MKRVFLTFALSLPICLLMGQHYHGIEKSELLARMKREHPEFLWQEQTQNEKFSYMKFVDALDRRTWLFFLDENDRCFFTRMMYDYTYLKQTKEWLDNSFRKTGKDQWMDKEGRKILIIQLTRSEWYFTVTIQESED